MSRPSPPATDRLPVAHADGDQSLRWSLLLAIALLALVVRLTYIWQISRAPFFDLRLGDAAAYHDWALRIVRGDWFGRGVFYQAPLYPYFLAGVYTVGGDGAGMLRFVQAVIGAGSCMLLAATGMALFGSWGAAAGVLLALYPPAIFLDGLLEKSVLVSFLTVALLYYVSASRARFRECLSGVVLGLLVLTRENAVLLAIPVFAWFAVGDPSSVPPDARASGRPSWRAASVFAVAFMLVLLPVGVRNYMAGGGLHLTTAQFGPNFYIGNHEGARGLYVPLVPGRGSAAFEQEDAASMAEASSGRTLSPGEVSSFWTARAVDFIRSHPGAWLLQLTRKLGLTYNAVEIADTESQDVYAEWSSVLRSLEPFGFGVVFGLGALGACLMAGAWRRLWFLYAMAITYTLSVVMFYVLARYRFPLVPVLMLLAVGGLARWRETPAARKRWASAALVLAAGLAYLPLEHTRGDRVAHYINIGNAFLRDPAKWDQAAVFYGKALAESPQLAEGHFGMGMVLVLKHQPREAIGHYQIAVDAWPENADVRLNFALALADVGDTQKALDELNAFAALRPGDPTPNLLIGKLLLKQSRPADALQAYERALAAHPDDPDALVGSGFALTQLKRPGESIERYRRALKVNPQDTDVHKTLGWTLDANGQRAEAAQEFERVLALKPGDEDARRFLDQARAVPRAPRE